MRSVCLGLGALFIMSVAAPAVAAEPVTQATHIGFDDLMTRLEAASTAHGLVLVTEASASRAAAARGIKIPGNAVLEIFNNDYAVRLLAVSTAAGIEAPLRLYLTENKDGTTTLTYRRPSALLARYHMKALGPLAKDLDKLVATLVADAVR